MAGQGSGPFYFVSDPVNSDQFYWRVRQGFGGVTVLQNYNLLATVLGDQPTAPKGHNLVGQETYRYANSGSVRLQPFAYVDRSGKKRGLRIGPALKKFLDNPLNGGKFNLSLPFIDERVALSDRSAALRVMNGSGSDRIWHVAIDFDYSGNTRRGFDVVAPADGEVIGHTGSSMTIKHKASNGREFLTIYQHLDAGSVPRNLRRVKRGQFIGRIETPGGYAHLHFGVAVRGPSRIINGTKVPSLWYLIDPFGVYDYRRNLNSSSNYNYLPNNRLDRPLRGRRHAYVFLTNPPIGSLLYQEDCVGFNTNDLQINGGTRPTIVSGNHALFSFPNQTEATAALQKLQHYRMNKTCFVGRPDPDFNYLLASNASPRGGLRPEDCISFSTSNLRISRLRSGRYALLSGRTSLFSFPNIREAGSAMAYILKYGFTKSCFIGRPDPSMHYLRR